MSGPDFSAWLEDFERQTDAAAKGATPPKSPEARAAGAAFDRWWRSENETESAFERLTEKDLALAGDASQRLARVTKEKEELEKRLARLERENADLKASETRLQAALADAQTRASRDRELLDSRINALDSENKTLAQRAEDLDRSRAFLQQAFNGAAAENKTRKDEASRAFERAAAMERESLDLRRKMAEVERECAKLREERAAQNGALEELRRQASVYTQRLVEAKERTDNDVALFRQDTKMFMEELRILANTIRLGVKESK